MNWANITMFYVGINVIIMLIFTIVVNIGGLLDLAYLFRELAAKEADELDDGRVIDEESKEQGHLC
jgi:hypothetical protein